MAFFELPPRPPHAGAPSEEVPTAGRIGPPDDIMPGVVPLELFAYHDDSVAVMVTRADVYPTGCSLWLTIIAWLLETDDEERSIHVQDAIFADAEWLRRRGTLSDALVRFGVEYPDGTKATTLEQSPNEAQERARSPVLLQREHEASGGRMRWDTDKELWLSPLPPPEPFDLVIEWPALAIPLTRVSLDGAGVNRAAARSRSVWP